MSKRISLGIDLGTTNSAIALTDLESDRTEVLEITQIIRPNQIGKNLRCPQRSTSRTVMNFRQTRFLYLGMTRSGKPQ